jgi:hypothetical protein
MLAQAWKVIPPISARLRSLGFELTAGDAWTLRREFLRVYGQSASRAAKVVMAIRELGQVGISAAVFKGVASMAVLYGGPKGRTIGDGDLLILRKDLPDTLDCLARKGFVRRGDETLEQYLNFVENAPRFAGNEAIALYGDDGSEIDIHWEVPGSGLRVDDILQRSVSVDLMGTRIPVVDSTDGFLLTVHHAIREDLGIESVCRDLLDVRLWCQRLKETGQLQAGIERAAQSGSQIAALAVTGLLRSYDETSAAARAAELLSRQSSHAQRRSAARLAKLFHYQTGHGRLGKDVFFLVHSRPWRQVARGLAQDWSGYRRSMQTLETQLSERQPLIRRLMLLARSVPDLEGLRLARELARVKYRQN